ncbi:MAG: hypothetical protein ACE5JI_04010 [Acidobacteriota bacterium]
MRALVRAKSVVLALSVLAVYLASCTATEDDDTTSTFLNVVTVNALGDSEVGTTTRTLESDVCNLVEPEGEEPFCTVSQDFAVVSIAARPKDQTRDNLRSGDVVMERYRVTFVRADGRNVPGVDVPFPFDGASNFVIPIFGSNAFTVVVVRAQSKLEPPLINLRGLGGMVALTVIAEIEFFGKDISGRPISVTAFLNITFADFAD